MTRAAAVDVLRSDRCNCGQPKEINHALCPVCWWRIPAGLRPGLYLEIGKGFEDFYQMAMDHLRMKARIATA